MNPYEEEMQNDLEKGREPEGDGLDVRAYREVFRALGKNPGYELPPQFAEMVAARAISRRQGRFSTDYFWFGAGIIVLAIAFFATVRFTGFALDFGFLKVMSDYKWLAVFAIVFIAFLNWLDKRLVKSQLQH